MRSGLDLVAAFAQGRGEPYSQRNPDRYTLGSGVSDCSGSIVKAFARLGLPVGGYVSTDLERWAVRNGGHYITREAAKWTPGAGLAIWGTGSNGHIGLSAGDGKHAWETPSGEGRKLGLSLFNRNSWGEYFTWPNIDHGAPAGVYFPGGGDDDMGLGPGDLDAIKMALIEYHQNFVAGPVGKTLDGSRYVTLVDHIKFALGDQAKVITDAVKALPAGSSQTAIVKAVEDAIERYEFRPVKVA